MKSFSYSVKRVIGLQLVGFIVVTVLLFHLTSPTESFGADRHQEYRSRGVLILPPPPPFAFLFGQNVRSVESQEVKGQAKHRREYRQTAVQKARSARIRANRAAQRGNFYKARRILAQAQRDLRQAELRQQKLRGEKGRKHHHRQENVVYYGDARRDDCEF